MKYFTEREFSGIFSLAGGGFCVFEKGIPGGLDMEAPWMHYHMSTAVLKMILATLQASGGCVELHRNFTPVMLKYVGEYCEDGEYCDACQLAVTAIRSRDVAVKSCLEWLTKKLCNW